MESSTGSLEAMALATIATGVCEIVLFLVEHRSDALDSVLPSPPEAIPVGRRAILLGPSELRNCRVVSNPSIRARACTRVFSICRLVNGAALAIPDDHATSDPVHGPLNHNPGRRVLSLKINSLRQPQLSWCRRTLGSRVLI